MYDEQWRDVMGAFLWILNFKFQSAVSFEGHSNKKRMPLQRESIMRGILASIYVVLFVIQPR